MAARKTAPTTGLPPRSIEQLEAEKVALMEEEAEVCRRVQREHPDDLMIQHDAYYHPDVVAVSDRLRAKIAEWHAALPDEHPEFHSRAAAPVARREDAERRIREALDRLHEQGDIPAHHHEALHASVTRTKEVTERHEAAKAAGEAARNGATT